LCLAEIDEQNSFLIKVKGISKQVVDLWRSSNFRINIGHSRHSEWDRVYENETKKSFTLFTHRCPNHSTYKHTLSPKSMDFFSNLGLIWFTLHEQKWMKILADVILYNQSLQLSFFCTEEPALLPFQAKKAHERIRFV